MVAATDSDWKKALYVMSSDFDWKAICMLLAQDDPGKLFDLAMQTEHAGSMPALFAKMDDAIEPKILSMLKSDYSRIEAIKEHRSLTGSKLKDSKDYVDGVVSKHSISI